MTCQKPCCYVFLSKSVVLHQWRLGRKRSHDEHSFQRYVWDIDITGSSLWPFRSRSGTHEVNLRHRMVCSPVSCCAEIRSLVQVSKDPVNELFSRDGLCNLIIILQRHFEIFAAKMSRSPHLVNYHMLFARSKPASHLERNFRTSSTSIRLSAQLPLDHDARAGPAWGPRCYWAGSNSVDWQRWLQV